MNKPFSKVSVLAYGLTLFVTATSLTSCGRMERAQSLGDSKRGEALSWQMPLSYAASDFQSQTAQFFANSVQEASQRSFHDRGKARKISIQTYPDSSLIPANKIKDAVASGEVSLGDRLLSAHATETPIFAYDSVPLLAQTEEESKKLWQAARPIIARILAEQNLHLLYSVPFPMQGIYTKNQVEDRSDLAGLRLRIYNDSGRRLAEHLGMVPVFVENSNVLAALEAGRVDAVLTSPSTGVRRRLWEHFDYFHLLQVWQPRNYVFMNRDLWKSLSRRDRIMLGSIAQSAEIYGRNASAQASTAAFGELAENGINLIPPNNFFQSELLKIGEEMKAEWIEAAGDDGAALMDAYQGIN